MKATCTLVLLIVAACATNDAVGDGDDGTCAVPCDDGNACTIDVCSAGSCEYRPLACDDGDACTVDTCSPTAGCVYTPTDPTGEETLYYADALQTFAVPACVTTMRITTAGAQGGGALGYVGGHGATIEGDFDVTPGEELTVLVGGPGIAATSTVGQDAGTGGGGSFVVRGTTLLVAAGGGGGAIGAPYPAHGGSGQAGTEGGAGGRGGKPGGIAGSGGRSYTPSTLNSVAGTGGGGFSGDGDGVTRAGDPATYGTANYPGKSFLNGGAGGIGGSKGRNGGFGGGGSAGDTGGGGGGYSGGGASGTSNVTPVTGGGGGGSFNAGTNQRNTPGTQVGDGQVTFSW